MDELFDVLTYYAEIAWDYIVEFFQTVILPVLVSWMEDVLNYFRLMALKKGVHTAFIMNTDSNSPFSNLIGDELKGKGIFEGVYNAQTDKLEKLRYVGGNGMENEIKNVIGENPITVLA